MENILVVTSGPDWFVKIGDFGISKRRKDDATSLQTQLQRGTLGYAAPEALGFSVSSETTSYTSSVDVWSLGAVAYKMLTNRLVFPQIGDLFSYVKLGQGFPSEPLVDRQVSQEARAFIEKLLAADPTARPTSALALQDPWITVELATPGLLIDIT